MNQLKFNDMVTITYNDQFIFFEELTLKLRQFDFKVCSSEITDDIYLN